MATVKREQILQEAEKLAARGKLDAAIKEYRRALEQAPNDTNTLNRLGDILVRVNRIDEAIDVYQQIAEHFAQDGFFLKAIAIFKKVNRLDPQRTGTYERLADLYFKQGLVVEGRQQLMTLADWFLRSRNIEQAVRIFRRLTELEPSNVQARAKLVDLLVQAGDPQAATTEIDALGRFLLGRSMIDEAIKLYHRAIELGPTNGDFVAPCIDAMLANGRVQPAMELAKKAIKATKSGYELRRAAARASAEAGDLDSARGYLEELMPEIGERTDIIQLYGDVMLRVGEAEEAKDHLLPAVDRLLRAGDVARAAALVKRLLRSAPTDIEVLSRADRVFERLGDQDMVVNIELALAEAYIRAGRKGEAIDIHKRLIRRSTSDPEVAKRLGALAEVLGLSAAQRAASVPSTPSQMEAVPPPQAIPSPAEAPPEDEISVEFIDVDVEPEVSSADTGVARVHTDVWEAPEAVTAAPQSSFDAQLPGEPPTPAPAAPSPADELLTEAQVFAKYGLVDKAISHLQRLLAQYPGHEPARQLLDSLGGEAAEETPGPQPADVSFAEAALPTDEAHPVPDTAPIVEEVRFDSSWEPAPLASEPVFGSATVLAAEPPGDLQLSEAPISSHPEPPAPPPVRPSPRIDVASLDAAPEAAARPAPIPRTDRSSGLSLDDLMGGKRPPTTARTTTARPVRMEALEAMLGLSAQTPPASQARPRAAARAEDVQLDLGVLGLPAAPPRRRSTGAAPSAETTEQVAVAPPLEPPAPPPEVVEPLLSDTLPLSGEPLAPVPAAAPLEVEPPIVELPALEPLPQTPVPAAALEVAPAATQPPPPPEPLPEEVEVLEAPIDLVEVEEILAGPSPEQLGELDFFIQQGLLDEAAKLLLKLREGFPDHPEVRSRHALLKSRGWDEEKPQAVGEATASELFSEEEQFFDLAAELEKELAEDELVAEATGVGKGGEVSIEDLFREFQRGVAEQIQEQDYDTHFNLGLAYREMGLLDEAIGEFQLALHSPQLFIEGASMIAACYMEKGLPEQAAEWYARGLTAPGLSPETVLGLRYELGRAQEAAGRDAEALGNFTEVLTVNPGFRDVVNRVSRLRTH
ncbi:MAG: tetratricopeptide repeat protein [Thermoanaerobaculaceae bacterium]|jgi:tetratricopeptide (TPR) repeat protein|nr:tetratricopeptide repeat protein [Thermoanaerobaculaceae bacterium]